MMATFLWFKLKTPESFVRQRENKLIAVFVIHSVR